MKPRGALLAFAFGTVLVSGCTDLRLSDQRADAIVYTDSSIIREIADIAGCEDPLVVSEDLAFDDYGSGFDCFDDGGVHAIFRVFQRHDSGARAVQLYAGLVDSGLQAIAYNNWFVVGEADAIEAIQRRLGTSADPSDFPSSRSSTRDEDAVLYCVTLSKDSVALIIDDEPINRDAFAQYPGLLEELVGIAAQIDPSPDDRPTDYYYEISSFGREIKDKCVALERGTVGETPMAR